MRALARAMVLLLALAGCIGDPGIGPNPYTGCYDYSCVDAPVRVPGLPALASVSGLTSHLCGVTPDGEAWCWGDNTMGQLGDGTDQPRTAPVRVTGGLRFSMVSVGSLFSCGIAVDSTAYCWGEGAVAQLGQPAPERCSTGAVPCAKAPLKLEGYVFTAIATGMRHACAIDGSGAAHCWGFNFLGEAGSTAYAEVVPAPRQVSGTNVFASIVAGDAFTCALTTAGNAFCWGSGNRGELGRAVAQCGSVFGFANYCSPDPVSVNTAATFTMLSASNSHVCGLTTTGTAQCWGDNGQGQLGTLSYETHATPVVAQGGMAFTTINASGAATCGTPVAGASVCWGLNLMGKLGVGSRVELSELPLAIAGGPRYLSFGGGQMYVCGIDSTGATYCWGSGREGQLGNGPRLP